MIPGPMWGDNVGRRSMRLALSRDLFGAYPGLERISHSCSGLAEPEA
jgi:hypothetical protein